MIIENTVKYYVKNIYSKFNIKSSSELIEMMLTSLNFKS
ncbi:MAG: response regulator transcription factor [Clostridia bacterium]|nr:response regulator transcription factor [Clostridia bacterium]